MAAATLMSLRGIDFVSRSRAAPQARGRLATRERETKRQRHYAPALLLCLALLPGCVSSESWVHSMKPAAAPQTVSEVSATWKGLSVTQDSVNGGQPLPGIAGRLYLFGPLGAPLLQDGQLQVDLYDATPTKQGKQPTHLERWNLDATTLKLLARKDSLIGEGYSLFLPWKTYRSAVTQVQMKMAFTPTGGHPIYAAPTLVTLRPAVPIAVEERQVLSHPQP